MNVDAPPPPRRSARAMRWLYLSLAAIFFTLAVAGVVLPVLPTTPFLLLTSWCLLRSSPELYERLKRSRVFGRFLRDWELHHGVRPEVKIVALTTLSLVVAWGLFLSPLSTPLKIALAALAAWGAFVVIRLRVVRS
jgi:uncharacterized protein